MQTTITLQNAVEIDGKETKTITISEPKAGELRGLSMAAVMMMETDAMLTLIPRISKLTPTHLENMGFSDLGVVCGSIANFMQPVSK
jgi:hypothetical protein